MSRAVTAGVAVEQVEAQVRELTGREPVAWRPVTTGYTPAFRAIVEFADGGSAFVKAPTDEDTATWLREEIAVYRAASGAVFPDVLAIADDPPLLVLEDLSHATWPPPWTDDLVGRVVDALGVLAATPPPAHLPSGEHLRRQLDGWPRVAEAPRPFMHLRLVRREWLAEHLDDLVAASSRAVLEGDAFVHHDIRSDNLCFDGERTLFVDWNWAVRGNAAFDLAGWASSLHLEGGPPPEEVVGDEPELAALIAGYFASVAGLAPVPTAPRLRDIQLAQLKVALPWAARALGLPPPW